MKKYSLLVLVILLTFIGKSQELNCKVQVTSPTLKSSPENVQLFEALQSSIFELMNNTKWTDDIFQDHEKIDCNMSIIVNSLKSNKNFEATIQITSRRPIFNSNYNSTVVNTLDKNFNFTYQLNTPIIYTKGAFTSNLPNVLAFYAYYMIGIDYDSYSLEGGTSHLTKAQEIANLAQSSGQKGWASSESGRNNRYWIIENALNPQFKQMRKCTYEYHRLGLDIVYNDTKGGVAAITKAITYLQDVHARQPGSINMRIYFLAKADEVVNIYSDADITQKNTVFNIVRRLDPGNIAKYQKIIKR
jgi:hypothetical protein